MKNKGDFFERVVLGADLPGEALPGQPLIEVAGDSRVLIENHSGVIAYGSCEIQVKVKFGIVCVCGHSLSLARMTKQQLVITGKIHNVALQRGRK